MRKSSRAVKPTQAAISAEKRVEQKEARKVEENYDPYGVVERTLCSPKNHASANGKLGQKKNCATNPLCVYGLGEYKNGIWGSFDDFELAKSLKVTVQQQSERRPGIPAGLQNLGATCYVNALLQTLFHNEDFRKLVYQWRGESIGSGEHANALQKLFVEMDISTAQCLDPSAFVKLLNLQTGIQQDAQEFNKLLLDHLSQTMYSGLTDMFRGELQYETCCTQCKTVSSRKAHFFELELPIKGMSNVESCIAALQQKEMLNGDNQYMCETCNKKCDAERRIVLDELPDVLNLQLMRFVFDPVTFSKRKLKDSLGIPAELSITSVSSSTPCEYDLQAILCHRGVSANSGHYVAEIHMENGEWWTFNDDVVEARQAPEVVVKKSKKGQAKIASDTSSKEAYMLVYRRRRGDANDGAATQIEKVSADLATPSIVEFVKQENSRRQVEGTELARKREKLQTVIEERKSLYQKAFESSSSNGKASTFYWVPRLWLESWITGERCVKEKEPEQSKVVDESEKKKNDEPIVLADEEPITIADDGMEEEDIHLFNDPIVLTPFLCQHGKIKPIIARKELKLISAQAWTVIEKSGITSDVVISEHDGKCIECMSSSSDEFKEMKSELDMCQRWEQMLTQPVDEELAMKEPLVYISKKWIKEFRERNKSYMAKLSEVVNAHGSARKHSGGRKRIKVMDDFFSPAKSEENGKEDNPELLNEDIICEHGALVGGKAVKRLLRKKDWVELVSKCERGVWSKANKMLPVKDNHDCLECQKETQEARVEAKREKEVRDALLKDPTFGAALREFAKRRHGHPGTGPNQLDLSLDEFVAIPRANARQLRDYLNHVETSDDRITIENSLFDCEHARSCIAPKAFDFISSGGKTTLIDSTMTDTIDDSFGVEIELVSRFEYSALLSVIRFANSNNSDDGTDSSMVVEDNLEPPKLVFTWLGAKECLVPNSPLCTECMQILTEKYHKARTVFTDKTIFVTRLGVGQIAPSGTVSDGVQGPTNQRGGSTRSTRQGNKRTPITASSTDTVYLVKMKIYQNSVGLKCEPSQIRLFSRGKLLEVNDLPLEFVGVRAGDDLYYDTNGNEDDDLTGISTETERGFQGTALMSSSHSVSPTPSGDSSKPPSSQPQQQQQQEDDYSSEVQVIE